MTQADEILRMIEAVDPADTAKMDEIDGHFWQWYRGDEFVIMPDTRYENRENVSTSLDAQKAIEPEGWKLFFHTGPTGKGGWAELHKSIPGDGFVWAGGHQVCANDLPTEELARLHVKIQAIAYERENHDQ